MRCSTCEKFVGQELGEPEDEGFEIVKDDTMATISGSVTLPIVCLDCGGDLKSGSFECSEEIEVPEAHRGDEGHALEVEVELEGTEDYSGSAKTPSRYRKHYYGVHAQLKVTCECGNWVYETDWSDQMQASSFDEC